MILVDEAKHVEPFRAGHSELLVLVLSHIEQFPEVQELLVNLEGLNWGTVTARIHPGPTRYRMETWNIPHEVALCF